MKKLTDILKNTPVREVCGDTAAAIGGLVYDSRAVKPGDCFFAVLGTPSDGHDYIPMAVEKGAAAIVCERMPADAAEREELAPLKKRADYILDTSHMLVRDLKQEIDKIFLGKEEYESFFVTILSFGFKYGIPEDSDLVFDVRFLPNPYYIPDLKPQTGNDRPVYDYVMSSPQAVTFEKQLFEMVEFLIPNYILEGKNQLVISIGCTGGKHRSVTIVNALAKHMKQLPYSIKVEHRDIEKDRKQGK